MCQNGGWLLRRYEFVATKDDRRPSYGVRKLVPSPEYRTTCRGCRQRNFPIRYSFVGLVSQSRVELSFCEDTLSSTSPPSTNLPIFSQNLFPNNLLFTFVIQSWASLARRLARECENIRVQTRHPFDVAQTLNFAQGSF